MSKLSPSRAAPQVVVIVPNQEFIDKLAEAAKRNDRSLNGEIVERLYASFQTPPGVIDAARLQMLQIELDIQANEIQQYARILGPHQGKQVVHTKWINIYKDSLTGVYDSQEEANKGQERIACIEIKYTEGEGL